MLAVEAQVQEVIVRHKFAETQASRYEQLLLAHAVSQEGAGIKRQELVRARADRDGLIRQRANLRLVSPVDGLVSRRDADPGTTVVAGQAVVEVIEPAGLWIS